jgi:hypothetical protein
MLQQNWETGQAPNGQETFRHALHRFALAALARELHHASSSGRLRFVLEDGAHVWSEEVDFALRALGPAEHCFETNDNAPLDRELWNAHERLLREAELVAQRWFEVCERLALSQLERSALAFLVAIGSDDTLARLARYAWADDYLRAPSVGFLRRVLAGASDGEEPAPALGAPFSAGGVLARSGFIVIAALGELPAQHTVHVHRDVVDFLTGASLCDTALLGFDVDEAPGRLRPQLAARLRVLSSVKTLGEQAKRPMDKKLQAAVIGPEASGRLGIAAQLASLVAGEAGLYHLALDTHTRLGSLQEAIAKAARIALLTGAVLAITGADEVEDERAVLELVHRVVDHLPISMVWISSRELRDHAGVPPRQVLRLGYPNRAERLTAWREALEGAGAVVPLDLLARLAGGFLLSEGQIRRAATVAAATVDNAGDWREEDFLDAARAQAKTGLGLLASPEECSFGLERLVLDEATHTLLQELVDYAQHRDGLVREWGFDEVLEKGLGVTALFVGPPGTGKSLAATALARELGHELYRVDLSQLVSKYIGETEKHLGAVFDAAEQGEVMLLFDEADSLFGKRTEVKTSVDRYANLEVNFLLQRIERFNGVVVLTTNHEKGIDDAFARRIRFRVLFEAPNAAARRRLWQALLPPRVPLAKDVDLEHLSGTYELSGGHIKEVILRAASRAYAAGRAVAQQDFVRSAEAEYRKLGLLSPQAGHSMKWER